MLPECISDRIDRSGGADACWPWTGCLNHGYGWATYQNRQWHVHRLVWERERGPIPEGLHVDHLCNQTNCQNPSHMRVCTFQENVTRSPRYNGHRSHCPEGHEMTTENTYRRPNANGWSHRMCRTCKRARSVEYEQRKRSRSA